MSPAELYLRVLIERAPPDTLLEVRYRLLETSSTVSPRGDFGRFFIDIQTLKRQMSAKASSLALIGARTDVYVGCAPRLRRGGRREDIAPTAMLWADCDTPSAIRAIALFDPPPTMTVQSGSATYEQGLRHEHVHAYWALTHPLLPTALEAANRRLAAALGADPSCVDAARILRVPNTLNFKHSPPSPTKLAAFTHVRHRPQDLIAALPKLPSTPTPPPVPARATRRDADPARGEDPLQRIDPRHYVHVLTGREPNRAGKIRCPFHEDRTPSLHA